MNTQINLHDRQSVILQIKQAGKLWGMIAAFFGASSVAMGAFAAHGLKAVMSKYQLGIIAKAAQYQMYHALAMLGITIIIFQCIHMNNKSEQFFRRLKEVNLSFALGIVMFSGSLYALAFTQVKVFAFVTPIGGVLFLLAWLWLIFAFYQQGKQ